MNDFTLRFFNDFLNYKIPLRRNTVQPWCGRDTEKNFLNQCSKNIDVSTFGPNDFMYSFNSNGYRSAEFNQTTDPKILYAGCSFTEGTGLPVDHIWGSQLNEMLLGQMTPYYACAWAGTSIESICRAVIVIINEINFTPNAVILLAPSPFRAESIYFDEINNEYSTFNYYENSDPSHFFKHLDNEEHKTLITQLYKSKVNRTDADCIKNSLTSINLLKMFLQSKNIPLLIGSWAKIFFDYPILQNNVLDFNESDFINFRFPFLKESNAKFPQHIARDFIHPNGLSHSVYASYIYEHHGNQLKRYLNI